MHIRLFTKKIAFDLIQNPDCILFLQWLGCIIFNLASHFCRKDRLAQIFKLNTVENNCL